jgi:hypothetical protein
VCSSLTLGFRSTDTKGGDVNLGGYDDGDGDVTVDGNEESSPMPRECWW